MINECVVLGLTDHELAAISKVEAALEGETFGTKMKALASIKLSLVMEHNKLPLEKAAVLIATNLVTSLRKQNPDEESRTA